MSPSKYRKHCRRLYRKYKNRTAQLAELQQELRRVSKLERILAFAFYGLLQQHFSPQEQNE